MRTVQPIGGLYQVRLTVEGMRHSIEHCLIDHDGSLRATVEAEIAKAVEQFDFTGCVRSAAEAVIRTQVSHAIERAVREAFFDEKINQSMNVVIQNHLRKVLEKYGQSS